MRAPTFANGNDAGTARYFVLSGPHVDTTTDSVSEARRRAYNLTTKCYGQPSIYDSQTGGLIPIDHDHDGGRAAARRARVAEIARVTGGASLAAILEPGERIRETHREPVKARPPRLPGEPIPETGE